MRDLPYDIPPWRPPSEAHSVLIRITQGCPWNRCAFCMMYKAVKFRVKSMEEIERDLKAASFLYGAYKPKRLFIGDSDSLSVKPDFLIKVLERIYYYLPSLKRVTSYARGRTLAKRKLEDLKRIREAGLTRLHVGLETGWDELLKKIDKGLTSKEMTEAGKKVKKAGFELSLYVILGLGGKENWKEHALETAKTLNEVKPDFIRLRTLIPLPETKIHKWIKEGKFKMPTVNTIVKELIALIENLECSSLIIADHVSNPIYIEGKLPESKERLLKSLKEFEEELQYEQPLITPASL